MISILDLGLGVIVLLFLVRGLLRGFISEIAGFVGIFLGLFVAGKYYAALAPQFEQVLDSSSLSAGFAYAALFFAALLVVGLSAAVARRFMTVTMTPLPDSIIGAVVGALKGALVCVIVLALMQRFVPDSPFLKNSLFMEYGGSFVAFARSLLPGFLESTVTALPAP